MHKSIPIWRDATKLLLEVEQAVRYFPRYHKYTIGSEMRKMAMRICRLINAAPCIVAEIKHVVENLLIQENGFLKNGLKRRYIHFLTIQPGVELCP